jgi:hypothetical protein
MSRSPRYYQLMASLPPLLPLFESEQTPISRLRLEERLGMLTAEDRAELSAITSLTHWHRLAPDADDAHLVALAQRIVPAIRNRELREVLTWRLELRSVVAALRRRHAGLPAPSAGEAWGFGRWVRAVEANWGHPDFQLAGPLPWVPTVRQLMEQDQPYELERTLLGVSWRHHRLAAEGHYFDFEAVVLYVLRWDLVYRWLMYDGKRARQRFEQMTEAALEKWLDRSPD